MKLMVKEIELQVGRWSHLAGAGTCSPVREACFLWGDAIDKMRLLAHVINYCLLGDMFSYIILQLDS